MMTTERSQSILRQFVGAALITAAVLSAACQRESQPAPPPPAESVAPPAEPVNLTADQQASLMETTLSIDDAEAKVATAEQALASSVARFQRLNPGKVPDALGDATLTDQERKTLTDLIATEKGSRQNMLSLIVKKDQEISELRARAAAARATLPPNYAGVTAGADDRHSDIAIDYLRKQGVSAEKAMDLVRQINLQEPLVPGFRVWTTYNNGQFGTWVTKGSATMTPQEAQTRVARVLEMKEQELAEALAAADKAHKENSVLASEAEEALNLASLARAEADAAIVIANENAARATAESNQVHYTIGSKRDLQKSGIIDGNAGLKSRAGGTSTMDVSTTHEIVIDPRAYKLNRVKKLVIAPTGDFKDGVDYTVSVVADVGVTLTIKDAEKFKKSKYFVVVLE